jgi:DNA-binding transcriptional regulator GbsR (MarR family)
MLYLCPNPITAEEISETLSLARSTVSTGLHELQSWGLIRVTQVLGDRRDYFETLGDVWEMFRIILHERKRREIDPTLSVLRKSVALAQQDERNDAHVAEQLQDMLDFFETITIVYNQVEQMPTDRLKKMAQLGDSFVRILNQVVPA